MKRKTTIRKNRGRRELTVERIVAMPAQLAWEGWTEPKQSAHSLAGQDHSAVIMAPDAVAKAIADSEQ